MTSQVKELEKVTNHCPKCDSEKLEYRIDIFKNKYTGDITCEECNYKFKYNQLIKKKWILEKGEGAYL